MRVFAPGRWACLLLFSACLSAAAIKGKVVDSSGAPVPGAQVSVVSRVGVQSQTATLANGSFEMNVPETTGAKLVVAAPGFSTKTLPLEQAGSIALEIAPLIDSVQVVGSAIEAPATEQGGSFSIIPRGQVRQRNEPFALDLLRYLPGVTFNQGGSAGGVTSLFLRGGNSNFTLVQIDGAPVNAFGGSFDFAHIPAEALDHIEMIRGPQSAVYGPYANSGVINFVTRRPESSPQLDLLAEGGSHNERRFGITGTGTLAGFGILASASRVDTDGPVRNSDYRNENVLLNVTRRGLSLHAGFDSNVVGQPGAWGSNPKGTFRGIDLISRARNNTSDYAARYGWNLGSRVRQELSGSFFVNNNGYRSPFGFSFNKDIRGQGEARTIVSVARHYTMAFGVSAMHEEVKNSFITDAGFSEFPIRRNDAAVYLENRFEFRGRFFLNAGLRGEWIRTPSIPADGFSRPFFPSSNVARANPKLSAAWIPAGGTRLHSSFGMGIRPPTGFELAFTNNPVLRPERTRSTDFGIEQKLFHNRLLVDATVFYNRYYDLIVTLGGSLSSLSRYKSANLANSRAQGAEFSASLRPARWVFVTASYTLLGTKILSVDGSNQAPLPFAVGQQLTRRPEHSGNVVATFSRDRLTVNLTGYFRGRTLFEEPAFGASNGLFWNSGFANVGINLNYALGRGLTAYGNLRNALNRHYEEIFGFPSPRLNFVSGLKWTISRAK